MSVLWRPRTYWAFYQPCFIDEVNRGLESSHQEIKTRICYSERLTIQTQADFYRSTSSTLKTPPSPPTPLKKDANSQLFPPMASAPWLVGWEPRQPWFSLVLVWKPGWPVQTQKAFPQREPVHFLRLCLIFGRWYGWKASSWARRRCEVRCKVIEASELDKRGRRDC